MLDNPIYRSSFHHQYWHLKPNPCLYFLDSQTAMIGLATKMDEYAPTTKPIKRVRAKSLRVSPPKKRTAITIITVVKTVLIDRAMVSAMLIFIISDSFIFLPPSFLIFSRIRSKITMLSLIE